MDSTTTISNTTAIQQDGCILTDQQIASSYNLTLHIVSVFVLLIVSLLGASISVASARVKALHISPVIINTGKFFGSGVVLATGWVHILPDAMYALSDPCLPDTWDVYGAYGGLFAMLAALAMQLIEFLAHQRFRSMKPKHMPLTVNNEIAEFKSDEHTHHHAGMPEHTHYHAATPEHTHLHVGMPEHTHHHAAVPEHTHHHAGMPEHTHYHAATPEHTHHHVGMPEHTHHHAAVPEHTHHHAAMPEHTHHHAEIPDHTHHHVAILEHTHHHTIQLEHTDDTTGKPKPIGEETDTSEQIDDITDRSDQTDDSTNIPEKIKENAVPEKQDTVIVGILHVEPQIVSVDLCETSTHCHGIAFQDDAQQHKISTYLLEFGIAVHSVLIGLTLGVTTNSFVPLFIALCFHQFFEAIALGAQIAGIKAASLRSAIYMVVFFTLTTPTGIAIGIGIHASTYNPKSVTSLIVTGTLESLSAGILIYVALVNLITAEMGANAHAFYALRTRLKLLYFGALYLGVAAMAVIGRWA